MEKLIVVGDIHTKYPKVERIISKYGKTHKFIFMGDYFDQFGLVVMLEEEIIWWVVLYGKIGRI
mgnify:CR=1 FL=1